jgi:hypothetical protein
LSRYLLRLALFASTSKRVFACAKGSQIQADRKVGLDSTVLSASLVSVRLASLLGLRPRSERADALERAEACALGLRDACTHKIGLLNDLHDTPRLMKNAAQDKQVKSGVQCSSKRASRTKAKQCPIYAKTCPREGEVPQSGAVP